ncbi:hypothetical protein ASPZODRAFT_1207543 [Penicilliopsis zonata CBS 506.65]|uniref:Uncharacterized protein n=1 Tax=Penicilliopsis zonata CBS 506.65 TaxID=1073090 RepID=A0A1L9S7C6_9EURO|nr:hypothetical protein ASPZODRAFT_1207543 [Penicilliopsis zonata CBS 506.65]OJJ43051.1 hypothetical protein ASPZODRAFT_1207543 [Penicilliopsis zonata CBS 506.65]
MNHFASPLSYHPLMLNSTSNRVGRVGRWYLPLMAIMSLGFGIENYRENQERRRDVFAGGEHMAVGDSLQARSQGVRRAMEIYEIQ